MVVTAAADDFCVFLLVQLNENIHIVAQRGERRRFGDEAREMLCRRAGLDHDYVVRLEEGSGLCADPLFFGPVGKMLGRKVVFFIEDCLSLCRCV